MKAVEWADKFKAATTEDEVKLVLDEYGRETAELAAARSKTSSDVGRFGTMDGAINEQRNKFKAVIGRVPTLNLAQFEALLDVHVKEYFTAKAVYEKAKAAKEKAAQDPKGHNNHDGRKFNRGGRGPQTNQPKKN
jgi:hypothetical protein